MEEGRFSKREVTNWPDFIKLYLESWSPPPASEARWIFRGQSKLSHTLTTTLEREAERVGIKVNSLPRVEGQLLTEFQRKAHHYLGHLPQGGDFAEWFSLMRHFGAPSRLLDWTYSPFIAAFFAVKGAEFPNNEDQAECVIWALDSQPYTGLAQIVRLGEQLVVDGFMSAELKQGFEPEITKRAQAACLQYLLDNPRADLLLISPFRTSERATVQQSVHLMPCDITIPFESNLAGHTKSDDNLTRVCVRLDRRARSEFLLHLHRVNVDEATLFPGLQGFAESLGTRMANPHILSWGPEQARLTTRWRGRSQGAESCPR